MWAEDLQGLHAAQTPAVQWPSGEGDRRQLLPAQARGLWGPGECPRTLKSTALHRGLSLLLLLPASDQYLPLPASLPAPPLRPASPATAPLPAGLAAMPHQPGHTSPRPLPHPQSSPPLPHTPLRATRGGIALPSPQDTAPRPSLQPATETRIVLRRPALAGEED